MSSNSFKFINIVWILLLVVIGVLTVLNGYFSDYDITGFIAISLHAIVVFILLRMMPIKGAGIIAGAFLARFIFMLWDLYASDIFLLPNSGGDSEIYYQWAKIISGDLSYLTEKIRGGLYAKILGVVFYLTGPMRILGQYINVLLGVSTVIFIYKIMLELKINSRTTQTVLVIAAFFPNSLIMSAILLREILPTFFVALSLLWFLRWYRNKSILSFVFSLILLGLASMFHSGVIVIAVGYLFMYLFYSHKTGTFVVSIKNVFSFIPVVAFVFIFTTQFSDEMFGKFGDLEEPGGIYASVTSAAGGAAYLEGLTINNPLQFLLFAPVRAFYFLFSPLPMNWRGVADIIIFRIDSLFYFFVLYYYFKNRRWFLNNKKLIFILLITIILVALVFGIGVSNAGTAMRHRQKIIPIFLVLRAIMMNEKYRAEALVNKAKKVI